MKRPAEALVSAIDYQIKHGGGDWEYPDKRAISVRTLQRWRKLAESIDGRMRLDGSEKNRQRVKAL